MERQEMPDLVKEKIKNKNLINNYRYIPFRHAGYRQGNRHAG